MTEREWWNRHVRKALHQPALGLIAHKAEDKFMTGTPDVDAIFRGVPMRLELKFVKKGAMSGDRAASLLRPSQRLWVEDWAKGGGTVLLLAGVEESILAYMYNATKLVAGQESKVATFTWERYNDTTPQLVSIGMHARHWHDVL